MSETSAERTPRPISELLLAGIGWASLGAEVASELADDLAQRFGVDRDEMRGAVQDALTSVRDRAGQAGSKGDDAFDKVIARWGLVRRDEVEELALRVAQLEHRLTLVERSSDAA